MHLKWFPGIRVWLGLATLWGGAAAAPGEEERQGLSEAWTFAYVLQADRLRKTREEAIEALRDCGRDLLVIDASFHGDEDSRWTAEEIGRMRAGAAGRVVVAYFSIGEAEDYRAYWRASWKKNPPGFLLEENPDWEGNYTVKYWDREWQDIILAELDKIAAQGFDGVYLDIVSGFENFEYDAKTDEWIDHRRNSETGGTYREDMIAWVRRLAARGREKKGASFLLIPQNGEQLLEDAAYRETIDAIGVEDLFTSGRKAQKEEAIRYRSGFLEKLRGKPVFCIEYAKEGKLREAAGERAEEAGYRILVTDRGLTTLGESRAPEEHSGVKSEK